MATRTRAGLPLRFRAAKRSQAARTIRNRQPPKGDARGRPIRGAASPRDVVVTVTVTLLEPELLGTRVAGETEHRESGGAPPQAMPIVRLKPVLGFQATRKGVVWAARPLPGLVRCRGQPA